MRLALVVGEKQGNVIKGRLEGIKDNLNMDVFDNVARYIDLTYKKNIIYDRVLVISNLLNPKALKDIHSFWGSTSKETQIVVMGKKGKDENLASEFLNMFQSPVVAFMLVENTTVQLIAEAVLLSPKDINDKYGVKDYLNVEIGEEDIVVPNSMLGIEEPEPEPQQPTQIPKKQEQPKKKGGLFGGLFGGKKNKNQPQSQQQNQEISQTDESNIENYTDDGNYDDSQNYDENYDNEQIDNTQGYQEDYGYEQADDNYSDENSDNYENAEVNNDDTSVLYGDSDNDILETSEPQTVEDDFDFGNSESQTDFETPESMGVEEVQVSQEEEPQIQDFPEPERPTPKPQPQAQPRPTQQIQQPTPQRQTVEEDFGSQGNFVDEEFDTEEYMGFDGTNDFDNDAVQVDEDFSNDTVGYNAPTRPQAQRRTMREVDDDMSDLNVASAEEAYRQQNEQPKVVVKEVVKEVTKDTGRGTINALKGLYAGRTHKIVIVTGDRGTGITSTALNLAKQFSQKVPVLYFDCDVDNHGLLSYINYDNFRDYENIHMQGVKLATNGKAFNSCVCRFEDNLDLLTTDYSCDVTDEEIEIAGTTVAEVSGDYGVVIVDCPLDKLHLISDLIMIGNTVLCVEGSKRGFMNMLCRLENSPLPMRYKRAIVSKGNMFITKCNKNTDLNRLKKYINDIFMPTGADWMSMQYREFNGKLTDHILNEILE